MKKINFEELMASVSEQIVEEAASFTPIKVFNTRFVALVACIAIIVTAIPAVVILNREKDVDAPKVTTPVEDIVVSPGGENEEINPWNVIYCSADTITMKEEFKNNALLKKDVDIKEFVAFNSQEMIEYEELEYSEDIPKKLSFTMGNKTYECSFNRVYNTRAILSDNEILKSHAKIAVYDIDNADTKEITTYVYYRVNTQEIVGGGFTQSFKASQLIGNVSKEEIKLIAERDLKTLYGNGFVSKYDIEVYKIESNIRGIYTQYYFVECIRKIGEFSTSEKVSLYYNTEGTIMDFDTQNLHVFDLLENVLNEKILLESEKEALKIYDGKLVESKFLEMGNDGLPYMYTCLKYVCDDKIKRYELHYKVNIK